MSDASTPVDDRPGAVRRTVLGEIEPARSRHMWTRSAVCLVDDLVVAGTWDGTVTARDRETLDPRWSVEWSEHPVTLAAGGGTLVVGGRGVSGRLAGLDPATGDRRWTVDTAGDLGASDRDGSTPDRLFELPYVVDATVESTSGRVYAAARRYERDGDRRRWWSVVDAFDRDGAARWRYETDASPIALDLDDAGERLAVAYNRCMGDHDTGLVVLDADTGDRRWDWDPGTEGDRRVGDVAIDGDRVAVASHGDKRGYLLGPGGRERWRVDLAIPTEIGDETLYAYPNHVHANDGRVAFVTGNTYAREGRETEARHPNEHAITAVDADGSPLWEGELEGFVHELATEGDAIVVPCAGNFRVRDPDRHAVRTFDLAAGDGDVRRVDGVPTAAAVSGETVAAIEEPVAYHDDEQVRGEYALWVYPNAR
ncbi:PQQ-binding-like beta-propeller repeat protein [Halovivax limisalsi]|uniref:outer membrane protein assembly factor BamB family protein n=1 Tax=Halovivax limisalsi TaxID=1453760 RepID=UPI001FFDDE6B|nr:PQQ-binding-like beta-propeller repeat protein [Halovivax limisalsi]